METSLAKLLLIPALLVSACASNTSLSAKEQAELLAPPLQIENEVRKDVGLLHEWYRQVEQLGNAGRRLTESESVRAARLGVIDSSKVRIVVTESLPLPGDAELLLAGKRYGLDSPNVGGRSHGFTIFIKSEFVGEQWLLDHELAHVAQIEAMGAERFLTRYFTELRIVGYRKAPLEVRANEAARGIADL